MTNGNPINDPTKSNLFNYNEIIGALYGSVYEQFDDKWDAQLGLRWENTETKGVNVSDNQKNIKNYSNLFPTFFVSYSYNENNTFSLSYGKRINRPNYWQLNPFKWYRSLYYYNEGNANLEPSISNNFEFSYNYKESFFTKLYYSFNKNGFNQIAYLDIPTNQLINRMENFYDTHSLGLVFYYKFNNLKWLESNNVCNLSYQKVQPYYDYVNHNENFEYFFQTNNFFKISDIFSLELTFYYNSQSVNGSYKASSSSSLNIGGRAQLFDKNLTVSFSANDIFKDSQRKLWDNIQGISQYYDNYYDWRYFRLSVSYRFGSKKINANQTRKNSNEDEKQRVGGN
jgi:outer membrane receptor protein involved in Fe transport